MKFLLLLLCLAFALPLFARHGKGGSVAYEYLGNGSTPNSSKYRITVKHYIDCHGDEFTEANVYLGIFNAGNNALVRTLTIPKSNPVTMEKKSFNACINPKPEVCYFVVDYVAETELADNAAGYIITEQECCRIAGIVNISNSSGTGITITNTIPGVLNGVVYRRNSSAVYAQRDTAVICKASYFEIDFSATDADGDQLTYSFCAGKSGGTAQTRQPNPPAPPPYNNLNYTSGYSADVPLGSGVSIDARTGLISGTAPATVGSYIISVCVSEYRGGVLINTTKKEVQVTVADCSLQAAALKSYINCTDYSVSFRNEAYSAAIDSYAWDFGVAGSTTDVSSAAAPTFTYADTGVYVLKLRVSSSSGCQDSATGFVSVYPGFSTGFTVAGSCIQRPFEFTDTSSTRYGTINARLWDFGDAGLDDVSTDRSPLYQYSATGSYTASLIVSTTKGCIDTVTKTIAASEKPLLDLPFRDTLICSIDTLQLQAYGTGDFVWTPGLTISNAHTASPLVYPQTTTTYSVTLTDRQCVGQDSVTVRVLDFISVRLPADTAICQGDSFQLTPVSEGLQYEWTPAAGLSDARTKSPIAMPLASTAYSVKARLGGCEATAVMDVQVVPYPKVAAGNDTTICFGTSAQLQGAVTASSFSWTPTAALANAATLQPVATPQQTTRYVLTARDVLGCPKPVRDTVVVTVLPPITAVAGRDTNMVAGQPLQLQGSGGASYSWAPATGLSNPTIANPVVNLNGAADSITYILEARVQGCSDRDSITIRIFKTGADIFVPTAFTPNGDGRNDLLVPVSVGMQRLDFFKVYNRWGQEVFTTTMMGKGWDGRFRNEAQGSGVFVFMAQGIDYTGRTLFRRGTVTLIR